MGQPALLRAAQLARGGAGAAQHLGRRRGDRGDHVPDRRGARCGPDVRRDDRANPPDRHGRGPARPARRGRRRAPRRHPRRDRGRVPGGAATAGGRREPMPRRSPPRTRGSTGRTRQRSWTDRSGRARRFPAPGRRGRGSGSSSARSVPTRPDPPWRPECSRSTRARSTSAPAPTRSFSATSRPSGSARWPQPTGPAVSGWTPAPGSGTVDPCPTTSRAPPRPTTSTRSAGPCRTPSSARAGGTCRPGRCRRGRRARASCCTGRPTRTRSTPTTGEPYDDLLVILTPTEAEKRALVEDPATPFITIDHFNGYNAVLVQQSRLGEISRDELREIITDAWTVRAPKRLVEDHLGPGFGLGSGEG